MRNSGVWFWVRTVLTTWAFFSAAVFPDSGTPMPANQAVGSFAIATLVTPILLCLVLGMQVLNPCSAREWTYPTWSENLLDFHQPLRFFHFGAFYFGAQALGSVVALILGWSKDYWLVAGGGGFGLGLWLGVNVVWRLLRWKRADV